MTSRYGLTVVELANGFVNRFLLAACRRVRLLPEGGGPNPLGGSLQPDCPPSAATRAGRRVSWLGLRSELGEQHRHDPATA